MVKAIEIQLVYAVFYKNSSKQNSKNNIYSDRGAGMGRLNCGFDSVLADFDDVFVGDMIVAEHIQILP
jgi:hypothetical protein